MKYFYRLPLSLYGVNISTTKYIALCAITFKKQKMNKHLINDTIEKN